MAVRVEDDPAVPAEWPTLLVWGLLLVALVSAAVAIGRLTARLFWRASGTGHR